MKKGSILISSIIILTTLLAIALGVGSAVLTTRVKISRAYRSLSALTYAEAGINRALWKINQTAGSSYSGEQNNTSLSGGAFDVVVENNCGINCKQITATGYIPSKANYTNKKIVRVKVKDSPSSTGVAFNYGVLAGPLGITMSNNSQITGENGSPGNVYAQGTIIGGTNTVVTGDVIMAGTNGKIEKVTIGGNAKARTIIDSIIGGNAYYQSIDSKTRVSGSACLNVNCHPSSPDQPIAELPISDATIADWESQAAAGGVINGDVNLVNDPVTGVAKLGPKKINGNLTATIGTNLVITGTIWVTGNISLANNMVVVLDEGYGNQGGLIVADNPNDKLSYGKIETNNNVKVCGSISPSDCLNDVPHPDNTSSIMFLSTNEGMTISDPAIIARNNSAAVIYYTTVGMLEVANNGGLKAFTGGGLHLSNGAQVNYNQGLASSQFAGGPGGAWAVTEWQIIN